MASRRIAKSAVDWAAFAERVPPLQKDGYRAMKAKSDMLVSRVHRHPENIASIDFAYYRSRLASPALVDQFEKSFKTVEVPYPKDKANVKAAIDVEEKDAKAETQKQVAAAQQVISETKALLTKIDSLPPLEEMTHEMYAEYFPDQVPNPWERPTFWPHDKQSQPDAPGTIH